MPNFYYKVRDKAGKVIEGSLDAADGKDLRLKLDEKNYFLIEFAGKKLSHSSGSSRLVISPRLKFKELSVLCWQLYTMLNAGVTLIKSLAIIQEQSDNPLLKAAVRDVESRVKEGTSFSESLKAHRAIFPKLFIQMVYSGEVGGVLDEVLHRMAIFYENQEEISSRIRSAMAYPMILLTICLAVVIFLVTYVLPKFSEVFEEIGAHIPWTTQFMLDASLYLKYYWYLFVGVVIGGLLIVRMYVRTKIGRYNFDYLKLNLPGIGVLVKKTVAARFTRTLTTLISAGIPMLTALEVANDTIDNMVVNKALKDVASRVSEGKTIAEPLGQTKVFPDMVVSMIRVGESTGALEEVLGKVADFYDREVDQAIKSFTKFIEPVMIVVMSIIIGFITVSIFLPLTDIMKGMHG